MPCVVFRLEMIERSIERASVQIGNVADSLLPSVREILSEFRKNVIDTGMHLSILVLLHLD